MIPKIQGSTQMPPQIQQEGNESAEKGNKKSDLNGPMAGSNDQPRTAPPPVQPRNPAAEQKFDAHRLATNLNAQLNTINGGSPKPPQTNPLMENCLISNLKDPAQTPAGEEGPKPESASRYGEANACYNAE